jgi:hypothetical protein
MTSFSVPGVKVSRNSPAPVENHEILQSGTANIWAKIRTLYLQNMKRVMATKSHNLSGVKLRNNDHISKKLGIFKAEDLCVCVYC